MAAGLDPQKLPRHVAVIMDGNGRWAKQRGLPRTEGHKRGEYSLFDVIMGAIELGIPYLSAYAFSTENWRRSPDEVRFLMGFNRDVIRRRRDQLHEMGVRVRWAGRRPRLWRSVISELEDADMAKTYTDFSMQQSVYQSALHAGAQKGQAAVVRSLLAKGANPNTATSDGFTPLMAGVKSGNAEVVTALVTAGADPNAADKNGWTPLDERTS